MSDFTPGLEGVVAFETEIAEPDRDGGALRYRGVDIEDLVGLVPFEKVWGLLVDGELEPGLPAAEPYEALDLTGHTPSDLQMTTGRLSAEWGLGQLIDIDDAQATDDLRRLSAAMISVVAQSARVADGHADRIPFDAVEQGRTTAERFLLEWRGDVDPRAATAIDTYWICTAEHGLNASTFVARICASTGADCGAILSSAVGALSGPLHGGAPARVLPMLDGAAEAESVERYVADLLDRGERLMGFGHRVYRAYDPRAAALRKVAESMDTKPDWLALAIAVEDVALRVLAERHPERALKTNVEYYAAPVLMGVGLTPDLFPAAFALARHAGWTAHVLEQAANNRLIRPDARYIGPAERDLPG